MRGKDDKLPTDTMPMPNADEPAKLSAILGGLEVELRDRISAMIKSAQDDERRRGATNVHAAISAQRDGRCWALQIPEVMCSAGMHYDSDNRQIRRCVAELIRREHMRNAPLLKTFGIPPTYRGSVATVLRRGWQSWRPVTITRSDTGLVLPVGSLMSFLTALAPELPKRHGLLYLDSGTGKSYCLAFLYFLALELGISAAWTDDVELRKLVIRLGSFDEHTKLTAEGEWRELTGKKVIFYNDLGSDENPPIEGKPGHPLLGSTMWRFFEQADVSVWASSNLAPTSTEKEPDRRSLTTHPDVSAKVVMRLCGERVDAVRVQILQGKAISEGRELTEEEWATCAMPALLLKFTGTNQRFSSGSHQRTMLRATAQKSNAP